MSSRPDPSTSPEPDGEPVTDAPSGAGDTAAPGGTDAAPRGAAAADGADGSGSADPGAVRSSSRRIGPRAMRKPERGETTVRDMLGALLLLIPIGLLIVTVGGSCSFAPTGPVEDPNSGPTVNVSERLTEYSRGSAFPLRVPDVPFRPNSTDRGPVEGGGTAVRIGYITPDADYLSLVQTDASIEGVLATESGSAGRGDGPPGARGTTEAGGLTWEIYQSEGGEPFRIATPPGAPQTRLMITGSGSDDAFRTLADALATARVLPAGGANR